MQYRENPHIEKNSETLKFRCTSCNLDLSINPGGASSHSQAIHRVRLDGSALEKPKTPSVEPKRIEVVQTTPVQSSPIDWFKAVPQKNTKPVHIPTFEEIRQREKDREFERTLSTWSKIQEAKRKNIPETLLAPLYRELGIDPEQERKIKENAEKEKRKKKLEEFDNEWAMYFLIAVGNDELQRKLCFMYFAQRSQI